MSRVITFKWSGRGETMARFLKLLGPRRSLKRYAAAESLVDMSYMV